MLSPRALASLVAGLAGLLGATLSIDAAAHARLVSPPPRSDADGLKDGNGGAPCGAVAPTGKPTILKAGAPAQIAFEETVNHPGCFLVALLENGDTKQTLLANVKHVADGGTPRAYTASVDLPKGLTCDGCTVQLRQLMLADDQTTCPPATIAPGTTYYSCADVRITVEGPPDAGPIADGGAPADAGTDAGGDDGTVDPAPAPTGDGSRGATTSGSGADAGAGSPREVPGSEVMTCSASIVGAGVGACGSGAAALLFGAAAVLARRRTARAAHGRRREG